MLTVQVFAVILLQASQKATQFPNLKDVAGIAKDVTGALQSVATVVALIVGGYWTYRKFVKNREDQPRANIEHSASHRMLPNNQYLLVLDVFIENVGEVAICLDRSQTWLQQIVPLPCDVRCRIENGQDAVPEGQSEALWALLGTVHENKYTKDNCIIDAHERDQFRHNFIFDSDVQTIQIYTYLQSASGSLGWKLKTTYDFSRSDTPDADNISVTGELSMKCLGVRPGLDNRQPGEPGGPFPKQPPDPPPPKPGQPKPRP